MSTLRTRNTTGTRSITGSYTTFDADCAHPGAWLRISGSPNALAGTDKVTTDRVTPGFGLKIKQGAIINNPFSTLTSSFSFFGGDSAMVKSVNPSCGALYAFEDFRGPWALLRRNADMDGVSARNYLERNYLISDADVASAVSVAATSCWGKSAQHTASILQDVAEIGKTISMLRDPLQTTSKFLSKIQKGRKGIGKLSGKDFIDYANNQWLQYRFGIRPLVSSVQGVLKELSKPHGMHRNTARANYSLQGRSSSVGATNLAGIIKFDFALTWTEDVTVRAGVLTEENISIAQGLGVDAAGMLQLPWELVPFSFVADWFANVGDYLESLVPYLSKSPLATWYTINRVQTGHMIVTNTSSIWPAAYSVIRPADEQYWCFYSEKIRVPTLPSPSLAFRPQSLGKVLHDLRVIDGLALVLQQMKGVFR